MADWLKDLTPFLRGFQVLIRGKLYYDPKTKQYYDGKGQRLTYGEVERQFNFNPITQEGLYLPSQAVGQTPRTEAVMDWREQMELAREAGEPMPERPEQLQWRPQAGTQPPELDEMGQLAAQLGVSREDLLRKQWGFPTSGDVEEQEQARKTQRWQMKQQARQGMWASERARQGALGEQWSAQAHRWGAMTQAMGQQGLGRDEKARIWESAKAEMLAAVGDDPMSWIKKWQVQRTQNPYSQPQTSVEQAWGDVETQREEAKRWKSVANDVRSRYKDPTDPLYIGTTGDWQSRSPEQEHARLILNAERVANEKLFEFESILAEEQESAGKGTALGEDFPESGGVPYAPSSTVRQKWHPPTPEWLSRLHGEEATEKQIWGTQEGFRPQAAPIGGQAWTRMPYSEREAWKGYVKWLGQEPIDVMETMARMLPQPRTGMKWQSSRQRA